MLFKGFCTFMLTVFCGTFIFGQKIGLRSNTELSDNNKLNAAFGGGVYLNIDNLTEKFDFIASFDLTGRKREFSSEDMKTSHSKYNFGLSSLYVVPISEKVNFKIGTGINYNIIKAIHQGIYTRWISSYKAHSIGLGLTTNIELLNLFKSPLNLDIFINPSYLLNIENSTDPTSTTSEYAEDLKILNIQLGLTYKIKKSN